MTDQISFSQFSSCLDEKAVTPARVSADLTGESERPTTTSVFTKYGVMSGIPILTPPLAKDQQSVFPFEIYKLSPDISFETEKGKEQRQERYLVGNQRREKKKRKNRAAISTTAFGRKMVKAKSANQIKTISEHEEDKALNAAIERAKMIASSLDMTWNERKVTWQNIICSDTGLSNLDKKVVYIDKHPSFKSSNGKYYRKCPYERSQSPDTCNIAVEQASTTRRLDQNRIEFGLDASSISMIQQSESNLNVFFHMENWGETPYMLTRKSEFAAQLGVTCSSNDAGDGPLTDKEFCEAKAHMVGEIRSNQYLIASHSVQKLRFQAEVIRAIKEISKGNYLEFDVEVERKLPEFNYSNMTTVQAIVICETSMSSLIMINQNQIDIIASFINKLSKAKRSANQWDGYLLWKTETNVVFRNLANVAEALYGLGKAVSSNFAGDGPDMKNSLVGRFKHLNSVDFNQIGLLFEDWRTRKNKVFENLFHAGKCGSIEYSSLLEVVNTIDDLLGGVTFVHNRLLEKLLGESEISDDQIGVIIGPLETQIENLQQVLRSLRQLGKAYRSNNAGDGPYSIDDLTVLIVEEISSFPTGEILDVGQKTLFTARCDLALSRMIGGEFKKMSFRQVESFFPKAKEIEMVVSTLSPEDFTQLMRVALSQLNPQASKRRCAYILKLLNKYVTSKQNLVVPNVQSKAARTVTKSERKSPPGGLEVSTVREDPKVKIVNTLHNVVGNCSKMVNLLELKPFDQLRCENLGWENLNSMMSIMNELRNLEQEGKERQHGKGFSSDFSGDGPAKQLSPRSISRPEIQQESPALVPDWVPILFGPGYSSDNSGDGPCCWSSEGERKESINEPQVIEIEEHICPFPCPIFLHWMMKFDEMGFASFHVSDEVMKRYPQMKSVPGSDIGIRMNYEEKLTICDIIVGGDPCQNGFCHTTMEDGLCILIPSRLVSGQTGELQMPEGINKTLTSLNIPDQFKNMISAFFDMVDDPKKCELVARTNDLMNSTQSSLYRLFQVKHPFEGCGIGFFWKGCFVTAKHLVQKASTVTVLGHKFFRDYDAVIPDEDIAVYCVKGKKAENIFCVPDNGTKVLGICPGGTLDGRMLTSTTSGDDLNRMVFPTSIVTGHSGSPVIIENKSGAPSLVGIMSSWFNHNGMWIHGDFFKTTFDDCVQRMVKYRGMGISLSVPPGFGKSTKLVAQILEEDVFKRILVLVPRVMIGRSVSQYLKESEQWSGIFDKKVQCLAEKDKGNLIEGVTFMTTGKFVRSFLGSGCSSKFAEADIIFLDECHLNEAETEATRVFLRMTYPKNFVWMTGSKRNCRQLCIESAEWSRKPKIIDTYDGLLDAKIASNFRRKYGNNSTIVQVMSTRYGERLAGEMTLEDPGLKVYHLNRKSLTSGGPEFLEELANINPNSNTVIFSSSVAMFGVTLPVKSVIVSNQKIVTKKELLTSPNSGTYATMYSTQTVQLCLEEITQWAGRVGRRDNGFVLLPTAWKESPHIELDDLQADNLVILSSAMNIARARDVPREQAVSIMRMGLTGAEGLSIVGKKGKVLAWNSDLETKAQQNSVPFERPIGEPRKVVYKFRGQEHEVPDFLKHIPQRKTNTGLSWLTIGGIVALGTYFYQRTTFRAEMINVPRKNFRMDKQTINRFLSFVKKKNSVPQELVVIREGRPRELTSRLMWDILLWLGFDYEYIPDSFPIRRCGVRVKPCGHDVEECSAVTHMLRALGKTDVYVREAMWRVFEKYMDGPMIRFSDFEAITKELDELTLTSSSMSLLQVLVMISPVMVTILGMVLFVWNKLKDTGHDHWFSRWTKNIHFPRDVLEKCRKALRTNTSNVSLWPTFCTIITIGLLKKEYFPIIAGAASVAGMTVSRLLLTQGFWSIFGLSATVDTMTTLLSSASIVALALSLNKMIEGMDDTFSKTILLGTCTLTEIVNSVSFTNIVIGKFIAVTPLKTVAKRIFSEQMGFARFMIMAICASIGGHPFVSLCAGWSSNEILKIPSTTALKLLAATIAFSPLASLFGMALPSLGLVAGVYLESIRNNYISDIAGGNPVDDAIIRFDNSVKQNLAIYLTPVISYQKLDRVQFQTRVCSSVADIVATELYDQYAPDNHPIEGNAIILRQKPNGIKQDFWDTHIHAIMNVRESILRQVSRFSADPFFDKVEWINNLEIPSELPTSDVKTRDQKNAFRIISASYQTTVPALIIFDKDASDIVKGHQLSIVKFVKAMTHHSFFSETVKSDIQTEFKRLKLTNTALTIQIGGLWANPYARNFISGITAICSALGLSSLMAGIEFVFSRSGFLDAFQASGIEHSLRAASLLITACFTPQYPIAISILTGLASETIFTNIAKLTQRREQVREIANNQDLLSQATSSMPAFKQSLHLKQYRNALKLNLSQFLPEEVVFKIIEEIKRWPKLEKVMVHKVYAESHEALESFVASIRKKNKKDIVRVLRAVDKRRNRKSMEFKQDSKGELPHYLIDLKLIINKDSSRIAEAVRSIGDSLLKMKNDVVNVVIAPMADEPSISGTSVLVSKVRMCDWNGSYNEAMDIILALMLQHLSEGNTEPAVPEISDASTVATLQLLNAGVPHGFGSQEHREEKKMEFERKVSDATDIKTSDYSVEIDPHRTLIIRSESIFTAESGVWLLPCRRKLTMKADAAAVARQLGGSTLVSSVKQLPRDDKGHVCGLGQVVSVDGGSLGCDKLCFMPVRKSGFIPDDEDTKDMEAAFGDFLKFHVGTRVPHILIPNIEMITIDSARVNWIKLCLYALEKKWDKTISEINLYCPPDFYGLVIQSCEDLKSQNMFAGDEAKSVFEKFTFRMGDISRFVGDAVVNSANEKMLGGSGVDAAISQRAGDGLFEERRSLPVLMGTRVRCGTGNAISTRGHKLRVKHIIHAVPPNYKESKRKPKELDQLLRSCVQQTMIIAKEKNVGTIAFPLLSCGVFRGNQDPQRLVTIMLQAIVDSDYKDLRRVFIYVYNEASSAIARKAYRGVVRSNIRTSEDEKIIEAPQINVIEDDDGTEIIDDSESASDAKHGDIIELKLSTSRMIFIKSLPEDFKVDIFIDPLGLEAMGRRTSEVNLPTSKGHEGEILDMTTLQSKNANARGFHVTTPNYAKVKTQRERKQKDEILTGIVETVMFYAGKEKCKSIYFPIFSIGSNLGEENMERIMLLHLNKIVNEIYPELKTIYVRASEGEPWNTLQSILHAGFPKPHTSLSSISEPKDQQESPALATIEEEGENAVKTKTGLSPIGIVHRGSKAVLSVTNNVHPGTVVGKSMNLIKDYSLGLDSTFREHASMIIKTLKAEWLVGTEFYGELSSSFSKHGYSGGPTAALFTLGFLVGYFTASFAYSSYSKFAAKTRTSLKLYFSMIFVAGFTAGFAYGTSVSEQIAITSSFKARRTAREAFLDSRLTTTSLPFVSVFASVVYGAVEGNIWLQRVVADALKKQGYQEKLKEKRSGTATGGILWFILGGAQAALKSAGFVEKGRIMAAEDLLRDPDVQNNREEHDTKRFEPKNKIPDLDMKTVASAFVNPIGTAMGAGIGLLTGFDPSQLGYAVGLGTSGTSFVNGLYLSAAGAMRVLDTGFRISEGDYCVPHACATAGLALSGFGLPIATSSIVLTKTHTSSRITKTSLWSAIMSFFSRNDDERKRMDSFLKREVEKMKIEKEVSVDKDEVSKLTLQHTCILAEYINAKKQQRPINYSFLEGMLMIESAGYRDIFKEYPQYLEEHTVLTMYDKITPMVVRGHHNFLRDKFDKDPPKTLTRTELLSHLGMILETMPRKGETRDMALRIPFKLLKDKDKPESKDNPMVSGFMTVKLSRKYKTQTRCHCNFRCTTIDYLEVFLQVQKYCLERKAKGFEHSYTCIFDLQAGRLYPEKDGLIVLQSKEECERSVTTTKVNGMFEILLHKVWTRPEKVEAKMTIPIGFNGWLDVLFATNKHRFPNGASSPDGAVALLLKNNDIPEGKITVGFGEECDVVIWKRGSDVDIASLLKRHQMHCVGDGIDVNHGLLCFKITNEEYSGFIDNSLLTRLTLSTPLESRGRYKLIAKLQKEGLKRVAKRTIFPGTSEKEMFPWTHDTEKLPIWCIDYMKNAEVHYTDSELKGWYKRGLYDVGLSEGAFEILGCVVLTQDRTNTNGMDIVLEGLLREVQRHREKIGMKEVLPIDHVGVPVQTNEAMIAAFYKRFDFPTNKFELPDDIFQVALDLGTLFQGIANRFNVDFGPLTREELLKVYNKKSRTGFIAHTQFSTMKKYMESPGSWGEIQKLIYLLDNGGDLQITVVGSPKVERLEIDKVLPRIFQYHTGPLRAAEQVIFQRLNEMFGKGIPDGKGGYMKVNPFSASMDNFTRAQKLGKFWEEGQKIGRPRAAIICEASKFDGHKKAQLYFLSHMMLQMTVRGGRKGKLVHKLLQSLAKWDIYGHTILISGVLIRNTQARQISGNWDTSLDNKIVNAMICLLAACRANNCRVFDVLREGVLLIEGDDGILIHDVEFIEKMGKVFMQTYEECQIPQKELKICYHPREFDFCSHAVVKTLPQGDKPGVWFSMRPMPQIMARLIVPLRRTYYDPVALARCLSATISALAGYWPIPEVRKLFELIRNYIPKEIIPQAARPSERYKLARNLGEGFDPMNFKLVPFVQKFYGADCIDPWQADISEHDRKYFGVNEYEAIMRVTDINHAVQVVLRSVMTLDRIKYVPKDVSILWISRSIDVKEIGSRMHLWNSAGGVIVFETVEQVSAYLKLFPPLLRNVTHMSLARAIKHEKFGHIEMILDPAKDGYRAEIAAMPEILQEYGMPRGRTVVSSTLEKYKKIAKMVENDE